MSEIFQFIVDGLAILLILGLGVAAALSEKFRGVIITFAIIAFSINIIFFSETKESKPESQASLPTTTQKTSPDHPTVEATLQNYRYKGDDIKIECSGPTGSIQCKSTK